jgi:formamidopyrimidine-DNA glycosylase
VPELPDITVYLEALEKRILGRTLERVHITGLSLLRTAQPPISSVEGKKVLQLRRIGKRIAIGLEDDLWLVLHLMIAGRLHWHEGGSKVLKSRTLAVLVFTDGTLSVTEAGSRKRASLHLVQGEEALRTLNPGGLEVLQTNLETFTEALQSENHTLKRSLTDPQLFSGIGNAYSDEILFTAQLSPTALTKKLTPSEIERLFDAVREQLLKWTDRLRADAGDKFPEKVTAFRPQMAVHGRYKQPCPRCGGKVQRIRYAANETNYCPNCQTGGKLLADRSLSRLLRQDWPKNAEDLENLTATYLKKSI